MFMLSLLHSLSILAQATDTTLDTQPQANPAGGAIGGILGLVIGVLLVVCLWKVFTKAGYPGWGSIIPIYNAYILCKIAGKSGWWVLLLLIPLVNFVIVILLGIGIAKNFGKSAGFGIGLAFLGFIFYPILAFGEAQYRGGTTTLPPAL